MSKRLLSNGPHMTEWPAARPMPGTALALSFGTAVAPSRDMLKLIGSYVIAKMLGFGLLGALVIYALLSLLT